NTCFSTSDTICSPAFWASASLSLLAAGLEAPPGIVMPRASDATAIVLALPITIQCPAVGANDLFISSNSSSFIVPPRYSCQKKRQSEQAPSRCPSYSPFPIGPEVIIIDGMFALEDPISNDGGSLSHPPMSTTPSIG